MKELESNQNWCDTAGASSKLEGEKQHKTCVNRSVLYFMQVFNFENGHFKFFVLDKSLGTKKLKLTITEIK